MEQEPSAEELEAAAQMEFEEEEQPKTNGSGSGSAAAAPEEKKPEPTLIKKGPPSMPLKSKYAPKIHQSTLAFPKSNGVAVMTDLTKETKKPEPSPKKEAKPEKKEEEQDPDKELAKAKKERLKELIRAKQRKEKKRKRANSLMDTAAEGSDNDSADEKEIDTDDEKITDEDRAFIKHPDEPDSESDHGDAEGSDDEDGKKKKKKKKQKKIKDDEDGDEAMVATKEEIEAEEAESERAAKEEEENEPAEELDAHMEEALAAVGSRASKGKGKEEKKETKKSSKAKPKICGWCDDPIAENWKQDRGENTGTGKTWVYFHEKCFMPFLDDSEKKRKAGQKPITAKGAKTKKGSDKPKEKKEEKKPKKEEKPAVKKEKKEEKPAAKKAKVTVDMAKTLESFGKARDGFDRFIGHLATKIAALDPDVLAGEMSKFTKSWLQVDKRMQEIEDGKTEELPDWHFSEGYDRDIFWWYLMASEHGFKEFKKLSKKSSKS